MFGIRCLLREASLLIHPAVMGKKYLGLPFTGTYCTTQLASFATWPRLYLRYFLRWHSSLSEDHRKVVKFYPGWPADTAGLCGRIIQQVQQRNPLRWEQGVEVFRRSFDRIPVYCVSFTAEADGGKN